jgi:hypothetical protein
MDVAESDCNIRTRMGQSEGNCLPQPPRRAGNQGDLSFEVKSWITIH